MLGALFVAFFLVLETGVIGSVGSAGGTSTAALAYDRLAEITTTKVDGTPGEVFLRGVGCNWLVCLAVWISIFAGVPEVGWGDTLANWLFAGIGNLVGAVVFVATSYWYLFLRADTTPDGPA